MNATNSAIFTLEQHGLAVAEVHRNLPPSSLYEHAIRYEKDASIADNGALVAYSGEKTGRSPKDKRVVEHPDSENDVWWGPVNIPFDDDTFEINRERAIDYLNTRERLYCRRWLRRLGSETSHQDSRHLLAAVSRAVHAQHADPADARGTRRLRRGRTSSSTTPAHFPPTADTTGMTSKTSVDLSLENKELVILGTEYAGEMKKGVFTMMNYFAPKRGMLSMHCSATADKKTGRSSLLFGLSRHRQDDALGRSEALLIGDDEHCWSDDGIFNIEGGCYAKAIDLTPRERAGDLSGAAVRRGAGKRRAR